MYQALLLSNALFVCLSSTVAEVVTLHYQGRRPTTLATIHTMQRGLAHAEVSDSWSFGSRVHYSSYIDVSFRDSCHHYQAGMRWDEEEGCIPRVGGRREASSQQSDTIKTGR
jgi:hypothetical protein